MKKISIITICFNAANTIEETINSVISQKTDVIEYIIVDGQSTDNTIEIVNKYKNSIDQIIIEKDVGISDAFNKGIKIATGEIIGFLNADDILQDGALVTILSYLDNTTDIYRGNINVWNSETGDKRVLVPSMNIVPGWHKVVVAHPGTYIKKAAYENYGMYDIKCKEKMDEDLLIRFGKNGAKVKYIPFSIVNFRLGGVSTRRVGSLKKLKSSLRETMYIYNKNNVSLIAKFKEVIRLVIKYLIFKCSNI